MGMGEVFMGPGFRTCSHAGCKWPAIVTLSFDYSASRVWLEDLRTAPEVSAYDLCSVHAGRFRPPKGWEVDDLRRVPEPQFEVVDGPRERSKTGSTESSSAIAKSSLGSGTNGAGIRGPETTEVPPAAATGRGSLLNGNGSVAADFTEEPVPAPSSMKPEPILSETLLPEPGSAPEAPLSEEPSSMVMRQMQSSPSQESATSLLRRMEIREEDDEIAELQRLVARDI